MRILFFHENFPGRFGALASYLAADPKNEVLFASFFQRRDFAIPGVRRVVLRVSDPRRGADEHTYAQAWGRIAQGGSQLFSKLERLNADFAPQLLFSSTFGGFSLFVQPAFPRAFHVFYAGWQGSGRGAGSSDGPMQARMSAQWVEILQSNLCFAFSEETRNHFPAPLRPAIHPVIPWVETDFMNPAAAQAFSWEGFAYAPGDELVSFNAKGLIMEAEQAERLRRLVLALLEARPACRVLLNHSRTPAGEALKAWRDGLPEDARKRLCVTDSLSLTAYRNMLCASSVHICPEVMPVFLMEKIETMSCASVLMTPLAGAGRFFRPGLNMLAYPAASPQTQMEAIVRALDEGGRLEPLRERARADVVAAFSPQALIPPHAQAVLRACEAWREKSGQKSA